MTNKLTIEKDICVFLSFLHDGFPIVVGNFAHSWETFSDDCSDQSRQQIPSIHDTAGWILWPLSDFAALAEIPSPHPYFVFPRIGI